MRHVRAQRSVISGEYIHFSRHVYAHVFLHVCIFCPLAATHVHHAETSTHTQSPTIPPFTLLHTRNTHLHVRMPVSHRAFSHTELAELRSAGRMPVPAASLAERCGGAITTLASRTIESYFGMTPRATNTRVHTPAQSMPHTQPRPLRLPRTPRGGHSNPKSPRCVLHGFASQSCITD